MRKVENCCPTVSCKESKASSLKNKQVGLKVTKSFYPVSGTESMTLLPQPVSSNKV